MEILEGLLAGLRAVCQKYPDDRRGKVEYSMVDIGLSAFSMFFMQHESFLSFQRRMEESHGASNCPPLFGIKAIPSDNHIRTLLDHVSPDSFQPCFDQALAEIGQQDGLKPFEQLGGRVVIALDGVEYFCSQKLGCKQCSTRKRSNGKTDNFHSMLSATIVAPGHNMVLPLMPEFITPQDGAEKQDCERNGAKRWLDAHAERMAGLRPIYLGDALFCCQPLAEPVLAKGADFIFVCKPDGHKTLYEYLKGVELEEFTTTVRKPGKHTLTYRYRWINGVPLRDGKDALDVNWLAISLTNDDGKTTYNGAFATSLEITRDNVEQIAACGRARWKIENESFNVLKNNGYNLAHNFGHGKKYLAQTFAVMNLLAFAFHTVCECREPLWKNARERSAKRTDFFRRLHYSTEFLLFQNWQDLFQNLLTRRKAPPT
jgi:Transposase DDE domain